MIIGIGSDLIDIRRVAKVIERHGDRFLDRIFTDAERARAARRAKSEKMVVATYAKRFAAKEACSKALGTGIRSHDQDQDQFLDAKRRAIRVRKTFCHRAGGCQGNWESDERDVRNKI